MVTGLGDRQDVHPPRHPAHLARRPDRGRDADRLLPDDPVGAQEGWIRVEQVDPGDGRDCVTDTSAALRRPRTRSQARADQWVAVGPAVTIAGQTRAAGASPRWRSAPTGSGSTPAPRSAASGTATTAGAAGLAGLLRHHPRRGSRRRRPPGQRRRRRRRRDRRRVGDAGDGRRLRGARRSDGGRGQRPPCGRRCRRGIGIRVAAGPRRPWRPPARPPPTRGGWRATTTPASSCSGWRSIRRRPASSGRPPTTVCCAATRPARRGCQFATAPANVSDVAAVPGPGTPAPWIYVATSDGTLSVSDDSGATWQPVALPPIGSPGPGAVPPTYGRPSLRARERAQPRGRVARRDRRSPVASRGRARRRRDRGRGPAAVAERCG